MKKTAVIIALALGFSVSSVNATNNFETIDNLEVTTSIAKVKVNPFCTSIAKGDIDTVKKLIELGSDVNQKSNGMTPLQYAAKFNRVEIMKLLIKHGAKVGVRSDKGMTAMKYAKMSNAKEAVALLKELSKKKKS
ncbi:ankyrin repeat domain-containing protein [Winogradskyella sp. 3972H.M.0a.05]|uniref:ankyrin repeat domain-containing protein n=1 Tax=Winogradskyella sp. 3972H.M.0a.05 TaxID=2950277 RepID=UPI0033984E59